MERTLDLTGIEVRDIEIAEAEFPTAVEFRVEGVVTDLSDETIAALVGKELTPKALVLEVDDESGTMDDASAS
jgi:hypothetical protein